MIIQQADGTELDTSTIDQGDAELLAKLKEFNDFLVDRDVSYVFTAMTKDKNTISANVPDPEGQIFVAAGFNIHKCTNGKLIVCIPLLPDGN